MMKQKLSLQSANYSVLVFADVKHLSIDFNWLDEAAYKNKSLPHIGVNLEQLLYFEQLEHLWISSHMDTHVVLGIPDSIDTNLSIRAKHLHLTTSIKIDMRFYNRFEHLETLDAYDCFMFPQMKPFGLLLEAIGRSPLVSISMKNPLVDDTFANYHLTKNGLKMYEIDFSILNTLRGNACEYLDFSYNQIHYVRQSSQDIFCPNLKLLDLSNNKLMQANGGLFNYIGHIAA